MKRATALAMILLTEAGQVASVHSRSPGYLQLAVTLQYLGKANEIVTLLNKGLALAGDNAEFHRQLGLAYNSLKKYPEAKSAYEKCLVLQPANSQCQYGLGNIQYNQGLYASAIPFYLKSVAITPKWYDANFYLAESYRMTRNYANAVIYFKAAIDLDSSEPRGYYRLGLAYNSQGNKVMARQQYESLRPLDPALSNDLLKVINGK